jgi:ribosome-associated protein
MDDTVRNKVMQVALLLEEHRGEDTTALYLGEMSGWTEYFVITTVSSRTHMRGILRSLLRRLQELDIEPLNRTRGLEAEGWVLLDCGDFIIHLMEKEQRRFYELEKLWFKSEMIYSSRPS